MGRRWGRWVLLLLLGSGAWLGWDYYRFLQTPLQHPTAEAMLLLAPGTSLRRMARQLHAEGWLQQPWHSAYWLLLAQQRGVARKLQAGEYQVKMGMLPGELLDAMVQGKVVQHSVTLVEGWRFSQVLAALAQESALRQTLLERSSAALMAELELSCTNPEGQFFPDTYFFTRDTPDVEILRRAHVALQARLAQAWQQRNPKHPAANADELLILASVVEKETGCAPERAEVAGVFVRRLQRGMRLQSDPTVIYGLGARFTGDLRRADLQWDSAYNTYLYPGLPPAPIALVSAATLEASARPVDGDSLYFVAKGDGCHEFSTTLSAHNAAVRRYQLKQPP